MSSYLELSQTGFIIPVQQLLFILYGDMDIGGEAYTGWIKLI